MKGSIVRYYRKSGEMQKANMFNHEQEAAYAKSGKAFLRLINEDGTPKTKDGKEVIAIKHLTEIKQIGFID